LGLNWFGKARGGKTAVAKVLSGKTRSEKTRSATIVFQFVLQVLAH